jgi:cytochrome c-type biogenesis protein
LSLQIAIAFIAGLLSFFSPCVLPLVPVYLTVLSGKAASSIIPVEKPKRWVVFLHGLFFILGFSTVFVGSGILIALLGGFVVKGLKEWIARIGGVIIIILGLHLTGILHLRFLDYDWKLKSNPNNSASYFSSFLIGIIFAAGWSACTGPILGSILTITLVQGKILVGSVSLLAYSMGLAIPFLIASLAMEYLTRIIIKFSKAFHTIQIISGVLLVILGILLSTGLFLRIINLSNS